MKDWKIFIIIIIAIFGLSFAIYWQFKSFQESLTRVELPEFKVPEVSFELWPGEEEGYKEWISPDGKLKIKYPSYWIEMEEESLKSYLSPSEKGEVLLFAYRFQLKGFTFTTPSFLVVQNLNFEKNLEKVIEEMEKEAQEREGEMKIINLKIEENQAEFEAEYKSKIGEIFYSKEKLILVEENLYSISIFSAKKDWTRIEEEANEIFDSIEFSQ